MGVNHDSQKSPGRSLLLTHRLGYVVDSSTPCRRSSISIPSLVQAGWRPDRESETLPFDRLEPASVQHRRDGHACLPTRGGAGTGTLVNRTIAVRCTARTETGHRTFRCRERADTQKHSPVSRSDMTALTCGDRLQGQQPALGSSTRTASTVLVAAPRYLKCGSHEHESDNMEALGDGCCDRVDDGVA
jgi:hypothetical protein